MEVAIFTEAGDLVPLSFQEYKGKAIVEAFDIIEFLKSNPDCNLNNKQIPVLYPITKIKYLEGKPPFSMPLRKRTKCITPNIRIPGFPPGIPTRKPLPICYEVTEPRLVRTCEATFYIVLYKSLIPPWFWTLINKAAEKVKSAPGVVAPILSKGDLKEANSAFRKALSSYYDDDIDVSERETYALKKTIEKLKIIVCKKTKCSPWKKT